MKVTGRRGFFSRVGRALVVLSVSLTSVVLTSQPALADHQSLAIIGGSNVDGIPTFGANEAIEFIGGFHPIFACPAGGVNDPSPFTVVRADVYVNGGSRNTVEAFGGLAFGELLGITQPSGALGSGTYNVAFDECQDGPGGPDDVVFNRAFRVEIPADVPPLDPLLIAIKQEAQAEADVLDASLTAHEAYGHAKKLFDVLVCGPDGKCLVPIAQGTVVAEYTALLQLPSLALPDPEEAMIATLKNLLKRSQGIAADPPDSVFRRVTELPPAEVTEPLTNDLLDEAIARVATATGNEASLAQGLLKSVERYQGADAADNGPWALTHAQAISNYADLLAIQLGRTNESLASVVEAISEDQRDFDEAARVLREFASRVQAEGFTEEERRDLFNLGISHRELADFERRLITFDHEFHESEFIQLLQRRIDTNEGYIPALQQLADDAAQLADEISQDPAVGGTPRPLADAGGPYVAMQGNPTMLDGGGSEPGQGLTITSFEWDLDGDRAFDDATGTSPTVTFEKAFDGFVGLRVTDSASEVSVDYAPVAVTRADRRPTFTAVSPEERILEIPAGSSRTFSISANDPDGEAITSQWFVDEVLAGSGLNFTFTPPTESGAATRVVQAVVSDGRSSVVEKWVVVIVGVDNDGDGYRAAADCNDDDPLINPGVAEDLSNGVDDDCDGLVDVAGTQGSVVGGQLFSAGGEVEVEVLEAEAGNDSELWLFEPAPERRLASNRDVGTVVELGSFPEGVELVFGIRTGGDEFRMGPGSRNPDGLTHAIVQPIAEGRLRVGFEDLLGGGDLDYNDNVFEFRGAITPIPVSQAPQASPDEFETEEDVSLSIPVSGLLQNDNDPDGGGLEVVSVETTPATIGSVSLQRDTVTYTPTPGSLGPDQFVYTVSDPQGATAEAVVTIQVSQRNRKPLAGNFVTETPENNPLEIALIATDSDDDQLTFAIEAAPQHGSLSTLAGNEVTYTPDSGYVGPDLFTYRVTDEHGATDTGTVAINVTDVGEPNRPPSAVDLDLSTPEDTPLEIMLSGTDPDDDQLTFAIEAAPQHGSLSTLAGNEVTYTPDFGYVGPDLFTYRVTDEHGATDTGTVAINVTDVGDALDCSGAAPSSDVLWPPNHKFHTIQIRGVGTAQEAVTITINGIFQDESVNDGGDGNTAPDGIGIGTSNAQIRAERSGNEDGRVYHIEFSATRVSGESCTGEVEVAVPHSPNKPAVDGGPLFDSTQE